MNMLAIVKPAWTVLQQGRSLAHPETWKNAQALTSIGIAVAALVTTFVPSLHIPADMVSAVAIAIAALANTYLTVATSEKVGFPAGSTDSRRFNPEDGKSTVPHEDFNRRKSAQSAQSADAALPALPAADRLRQPMPADHQSCESQRDDSADGWNG